MIGNAMLRPAVLRCSCSAIFRRLCAAGLSGWAIKMGWRPFGRVSRQLDELLIRTARDTVGPDVELMVDAGGSEQFWPHSVHWARETARMLGDYQVTWFEEALRPDDVEGAP